MIVQPVVEPMDRFSALLVKQSPSRPQCTVCPPDAAATPPDEQVLESLPEGRGEERVEDRVDAGVAIGQHVAPYLCRIWIFRHVFFHILIF